MENCTKNHVLDYFENQIETGRIIAIENYEPDVGEKILKFLGEYSSQHLDLNMKFSMFNNGEELHQSGHRYFANRNSVMIVIDIHDKKTPFDFWPEYHKAANSDN